MKAHRGSTEIAVCKGYWFRFTHRQLYPRERTPVATGYEARWAMSCFGHSGGKKSKCIPLYGFDSPSVQAVSCSLNQVRYRVFSLKNNK